MAENQSSLFAKLTHRKSKGNKAETQACAYLQAKGLKLITKNFSTKSGEIDLIMDDNDTLVFIEVRYRKNTDFGGAAASVTPKKQQRIIKAALAYQQHSAPQSAMRFDVIAIEGSEMKIEWIKSAFDGF